MDFPGATGPNGEWTYEMSQEVEEKICREIAAAILDDGEISASEKEEIKGAVLIDYCADFLLQGYDHGDEMLGEDILALDRDELETVAPVLCARSFSDTTA